MSAMTATSPSRFRLAPRTRKLVLLVHVISSVGWLGIHLGNIVFVMVGLLTSDPATQRTAFLAVELLGGIVLIPISLLAFTTGVILGLGTKWGLVRHWWVLTKFVLTLVPVFLIPLSLLPGYGELADAVRLAPDGQLADVGSHGSSMVGAAVVSTTMYVTSTVLSVFKPWGRTRWGKRRQARVRATAAV
jgi:hypothetical protein